MSIQAVFFSPTGNTEKSVRAMAEAISRHLAKKEEYKAKAWEPGNQETKAPEALHTILVHDCTCVREESGLSKYVSADQEICFTEEDFAIFGAPVYGGRIPEAAMARLRKFKGSRTPCLLVASYGNRHYDDALIELKDMAEQNGFVVKGAAAVIGRHTFGEIQVDRPDDRDLQEMEEFAVKAYERENALESIPGNSSYREGGKGGKFRPSTLESCVKCGICKKNCPVAAIDDNFRVKEEACISCFRCIRNCPVKAKVMQSEAYDNFAADFTKKLSQRRENEFF